MRIKQLLPALFMALLTPSVAQAQKPDPTLSPTATYINDEGVETVTDSDVNGQAPLTVTFRANPSNMEEFNPSFEWHFQLAGEEKAFMVRYEQDTEYTFTTSGTTNVTLLVKSEGEVIDSTVIKVTVSESKLVFPNAFSPNGDEYNQIYKAKEYQSIIDFHAYIFNRWGQKLFEWTDPAQGWDGTYNGHDVKEGVYFVLVKARGADGREYNIRKDVNLLRNYNDTTTTNEK